MVDTAHVVTKTGFRGEFINSASDNGVETDHGMIVRERTLHTITVRIICNFIYLTVPLYKTVVRCISRYDFYSVMGLTNQHQLHIFINIGKWSNVRSVNIFPLRELKF